MIRNPSLRALVILSLTAFLALAAGCGSIGPKTMHHDQIDYGHSIGDNWKNQMLANIVKMRYLDMPVFVDVGSIVSGYTLETQVSGRLGFSDSFTGGDTQGLGASGKYTDRPTITYMPKTGDDYLRSLLEPVEPRNLLALVQAGYSAELLFTWTVEAVNGIHNYSVTSSRKTEADPEFYEYTRLLQEMQNAGAIGFEFESDPETGHDVILVLRQHGVPDEILTKRQRSAEILGLDLEANRFRVVYAPFKIDGSTLSLQTRSITQTLSAMAGFVDVPAELANQATPGFRIRQNVARPFHVLSGPERPEQAFATIRYKDHWYWIEDTDLASKRVFTLMLFLTTLTNQARDERGPVLTIPTS